MGISCDGNWMTSTGITYLDKARYTVNFEQHDEHIRMNIREVTMHLCLWIFDGICRWIRTICRFQKCIGVDWTFFGPLKRQQFGRCVTQQLYIESVSGLDWFYNSVQTAAFLKDQI